MVGEERRVAPTVSVSLYAGWADVVRY
jgi:hypothetical protein